MAAKMNTAAIQKAFKIIGKLIYVGLQGPADAGTYRTAMSGLVDQVASGSASDAVAITKVASPAATALDTINVTLSGLGATFKTQVSNYLTQVMSVDQGSTGANSV